jgi:RNA polymerase sigma-70 factor (ECF subfamily)
VDQSWDELEAWGRAKDHDARAFAAIFDHHEARVFRHSLRLTRNVADAEDVTAAAFFELWRRRSAVRLVAGSTLPWLLVTATNVSRNQRRALRRYGSLLDQLPRGGVDEISPALDTVLEIDRDLYQAMRSLGSVDASLLLLTAVEELPVKEAAALLGISDGAARVRLTRAKKRMRSQLQQPDPRVLAMDERNR